MHSGFAILVACGPVVLLIVSILVGGLILLALYAIALYGFAILFDPRHRSVTGAPKQRFWRLESPPAVTPHRVRLIGTDD